MSTLEDFAIAEWRLNDEELDGTYEIFPLTLQVFERSLTPEGLPIPKRHDRFIVSTGPHLQDLGDTVEIVTKDEKITDAVVLPVI